MEALCVFVCVCACVRVVRCELKFYILFTTIPSLTRFTYLNPGLLVRSEYQWGRFSDRPTRDRDFPRFSSVIEHAQLVHEARLALRSAHAAFAVAVTNFCWIQRSITVKHTSLIFVIFATCFSPRNHHRAFLYKNLKPQVPLLYELFLYSFFSDFKVLNYWLLYVSNVHLPKWEYRNGVAKYVKTGIWGTNKWNLCSPLPILQIKFTHIVYR